MNWTFYKVSYGLSIIISVGIVSYIGYTLWYDAAAHELFKCLVYSQILIILAIMWVNTVSVYQLTSVLERSKRHAKSLSHSNASSP